MPGRVRRRLSAMPGRVRRRLSAVPGRVWWEKVRRRCTMPGQVKCDGHRHAATVVRRSSVAVALCRDESGVAYQLCRDKKTRRYGGRGARVGGGWKGGMNPAPRLPNGDAAALGRFRRDGRKTFGIPQIYLIQSVRPGEVSRNFKYRVPDRVFQGVAGP